MEDVSSRGVDRPGVVRADKVVGNSSDLVFLEEVCYEGARTFRFDGRVLSFDQRPMTNDTSGSVWPSAVRLAYVIFNQRTAIRTSLNIDSGRPTRVLELGCGSIPLVSAACACADMIVTATDLPGVIQKARQCSIIHEFHPQLNFASLDWTDTRSVDEFIAQHKPCAFDLIVGADLIYSEPLLKPLINVLRLTLLNCCSRDSYALLCWQLRNQTLEQMFLQGLRDAGLVYSLVPRTKSDSESGEGALSENHFRYTRVIRVCLDT